MHIYIDLETIPAQDDAVRQQLAQNISPPGNISKPETIAAWMAEKKPAAVEEAWRKTSFDGAYGQIVVVSIAINDEAPMTFYHEDWRNGESDILHRLFDAINDAHQQRLKDGLLHSQHATFIGHNIAGFDLPFLFQRAVILGIKPPVCIPFGARPWDFGVYDTMSRWHPDRDKRTSLDKLCSVFGIAAKGSEIGEEIDGGMVWDFIRDGKIEQVAAYCAGDVERVRAVHKRLTFA